MELEPEAFGGGGRFPVQVRFVPSHPSGQVFWVPESALRDVLRYRNASTRFDLLLRGRAVDKMVGIFAEHGVPLPRPKLPSPRTPLGVSNAPVPGQPPLPPKLPATASTIAEAAMPPLPPDDAQPSSSPSSSTEPAESAAAATPPAPADAPSEESAGPSVGLTASAVASMSLQDEKAGAEAPAEAPAAPSSSACPSE